MLLASCSPTMWASLPSTRTFSRQRHGTPTTWPLRWSSHGAGPAMASAETGPRAASCSEACRWRTCQTQGPTGEDSARDTTVKEYAKPHYSQQVHGTERCLRYRV